MDVLGSSHPEGKWTTATLKPHQEAPKRGPALLNGSQDHPTADTADYTQACQGWSKGSSISLPPTKGQNPPFLKAAFRLEQKDLIQKAF